MPERTLQRFRRRDAGVAGVEGLVVSLLLLSMIGVAAGQALWFNLAERGVGWAAWLLEASAWADLAAEAAAVGDTPFPGAAPLEQMMNQSPPSTPSSASPALGAPLRATLEK